MWPPYPQRNGAKTSFSSRRVSDFGPKTSCSPGKQGVAGTVFRQTVLGTLHPQEQGGSFCRQEDDYLVSTPETDRDVDQKEC